MLKLSFLILGLMYCFCAEVKGQKQYPTKVDTSFFCWTPATKNKVVHGIAIGFTAHPWSTWVDTVFVKVNGINVEVGPLGIIGGLWGTMFGFAGGKGDNGNKVSFFTNNGYDSLITGYPKYGTHINGLSISIGGISETYNHGVFINGLSGYCYEIKGIQISGLVNNTFELKGIAIAGIANVVTKGKGIQIGLINKCQTGSVLQIGLFNRIGKRVVPFINFSINKKK